MSNKQTQPIIPYRLYKATEAADLLGIPAEEVRALVNTGQLRAKRFRVNSHPRIPGQAILNFIQNTAAPTAVNE